MSATAKAGDRVLFTGDSIIYGGGSHMEFLKENRVYGIVQDKVTHEKHHVPTGYLLINYLQTFPAYRDICTQQMIETKDVTIIPAEQHVESDEQNRVASTRLKEWQDRIPNRCKTDATVSFMNRTFNFDEFQALDTNHSYAMQGTWRADGGWENYQRQYRPACCAFTKVANSFRVWIPNVWLNYYGYTTYDLVEYLKFLSKCEIGFEYQFHGDMDLDPLFDGSINKQGPDMIQQISVGQYASLMYPNKFSGFKCVQMKGGPAGMHTYLRFIALRYMYNMKYWTIPGHAMQIKKALGSLVTHWEALLLAHLGKDYYGYYCFVSQKHADVKRPLKWDPNSPTASGTNYDLWVDPYQKVDMVLSKLRGSSTMNTSFEYVKNVYVTADLQKFFAEKDWMGLYNYTKERKENSKK